jgi:cytochrome P450
MTTAELSFEQAFATDEFIRNPYPVYDRLLREAPVWKSPHGKYFVSSHRLISEILADHERFPQPEDPNPSFHGMNPPEHTRLRRMVSSAFTPRATQRQRARIAEIVADLVGAMQPGTDIDLKQALSVQLPTRMITGLLGVPLEDGELWGDWANALHEATSFPRFLPEQDERVSALRDKARAAAAEERDYFRDLVRARRAQPGSDLISELVSVEDGSDRLTEDELVTTLVLLLGGGHHTSITLISACVYWLLQNPNQLAAVNQDPSLVSGAVEETIRFDTPLQSVDRLIGEQPAQVGGYTIEPDTRITLLLGAANRDPEVFDQPNEFRIDRANSRKNVSLGLGVHFCLGAPLARAEGEEALKGLLGRFPGLSLIPGDPPVNELSYTLRGFERVPVRLPG